MRRLGLTNWLVGATDHDALMGMLRAGTPCFSIPTSLPEGEWSWGSPAFHSLGPHKIELIHRTLQWGFELIITDVSSETLTLTLTLTLPLTLTLADTPRAAVRL